MHALRLHAGVVDAGKAGVAGGAVLCAGRPRAKDLLAVRAVARVEALVAGERAAEAPRGAETVGAGVLVGALFLAEGGGIFRKIRSAPY